MTRRAPGEGSIYQRSSDGRWVGELLVGWKDGGKPQKKYVSGKTRREVQMRLADLRRQQSLGVDIRAGEQTVEQFLTRWLAWKRNQVRPLTHYTYDRYIEAHIIPAIGRVRLANLRVAHVQAMLDARKDSLSPRSVQALRDILRGALNDAVAWGELERNPAQHARPPGQEHKAVAALTIEQAEKILEAAKGQRLEAVIRVAIALGLRRSEICGLRWEHVDLERGTLRVEQGRHRSPGQGFSLEGPKSMRSRRELALPKITQKVLKQHRQRQLEDRMRATGRWTDTGFVFTDRWGEPLKPDNVSKDFRKLAKDAGLPELNFHKLRHGAASLLLAQGVSLPVIQETLGHADFGFTRNRYAHLAPELQRAAADAMDELFGESI